MSTWKMSRYFSARGHSVAIVSCAADGHKPQDFAILYSPETSSGGVSAEAISCINRALDEFRPTIVINQMPYESSISKTLKVRQSYVLLACLRNTLFSVKANIDQYIERAFPTRIRPFLKNNLLRKILLSHHRMRHRRQLQEILDTYDKFVMFGPPNIDELNYFVPEFDRNKIILIPNSVPKVAVDVPKKEKRILWLGRLNVSQKRADLIVPVWKRVSAILADWHLDVVGDGPAADDLKSSIKKSGLDRITLYGRRPAEEFYQRSPIFIMTSVFEGFPNTLVEAQSAGAVPVLFDSFPIASWVIKNGVNGFLVDPFDVEAMANRVVLLAQDTDLPSLQDNALVNARRFDISTVGEMWLGLFEDCIEMRRRACTKSSADASLDAGRLN